MKNTSVLFPAKTLSSKRTLSILSLFLFMLLMLPACDNGSGTNSNLPKSTPEAEGIASGAILDFLDAVEASGIELHSFMILRHGKVVSEGYWSPYRPELKNTLYSVSKSFTSTAIGFAVSEGLISVHDKVISFFPEYLPDSISPNLADMEIHDLLCMSAGQVPDPTFSLVNEKNWIKAFLALPVVNDPGTVFLYNSAATYMLSAIISKVTGENLLSYLTPRLFEPLGIEDMDWETDPMGINTGGWGLRLKTEDMARFGQLYLQNGKWNGRQVVPEEWVNEATTMKIMQHPEFSEEERSNSDWEQGYCYKFWRSRHNSFRADGAYGQFILILPELDAVIIMTAEAFDLQKELNLPWDYLLPGFTSDPLKPDAEITAQLEKRIKNLSVKLPSSDINTDFSSLISGKTYTLITEDTGETQKYSFSFSDSTCTVNYSATEGSGQSYTYGKNFYFDGISPTRGPNLLPQATSDTAAPLSYRVAGACKWTSDTTLSLYLRYIESPHTWYQTLHFDGDNVSMESWNSRSGRDNGVISSGMAVK